MYSGLCSCIRSLCCVTLVPLCVDAYMIVSVGVRMQMTSHQHPSLLDALGNKAESRPLCAMAAVAGKPQDGDEPTPVCFRWEGRLSVLQCAVCVGAGQGWRQGPFRSPFPCLRCITLFESQKCRSYFASRPCSPTGPCTGMTGANPPTRH